MTDFLRAAMKPVAMSPGWTQVTEIPKGFTSYEHKDADVRMNEDGTFFVTTLVTVTTHDGEQYEAKAVSLFVENEASAFGYNIVSSDILTAENCSWLWGNTEVNRAKSFSSRSLHFRRG